MKVLGIVFLSSLSLLCKGMERTAPPPAPTNNQIVLAQSKSNGAQVIGLPMRESPPSSSSSSSEGAKLEDLDAVRKEPVKRGSRIVIDQRNGTSIVVDLPLPGTDTNEHIQEIRIALENNDPKTHDALHGQMAQDALRIVCDNDEKRYNNYKVVLPRLETRFKESLKKKAQPAAPQSPPEPTRSAGKETASQPSETDNQHIERLKQVSIVQLSARRAEEIAKKTPPPTPDLESPATRKSTPTPRELYLNAPSNNPQNSNGTNTNALEQMIMDELAAHGASERFQKFVASGIAAVGGLATLASWIYNVIPKGTTIPGTNFTLPPG